MERGFDTANAVTASNGFRCWRDRLTGVRSEDTFIRVVADNHPASVSVYSETMVLVVVDLVVISLVFRSLICAVASSEVLKITTY